MVRLKSASTLLTLTAAGRRRGFGRRGAAEQPSTTSAEPGAVSLKWLDSCLRHTPATATSAYPY